MLKIGKHTLKNNLILAPMAGYSNAAFRTLMAEHGAGLTVTEMVSVNGLNYHNEKTHTLLKTSPAEEVKCVQLFGFSPQDFVKAVRLEQLSGFDIIDINMGCPVRKVFSIGCGCALMGDAERAAAIVSALKAEGKTVAVKTRLGIDRPDDVLDFALKMEGAGADLITVHCRTAKQMYSGKPDYSAVRALKQSLRVPVVINGDILNRESYDEAARTGADGFMIGRGALYNPLIFEQLSGVQTGADRAGLILKLVDYMSADLGRVHAAKELRKFMPYMLKDLAKRSERHKLNFIADSAILKQELRAIFDKTF